MEKSNQDYIPEKFRKQESAEILPDDIEIAIKEADVIFILAHGNPPEEKLSKDARLRALAAVEASKINPNLEIAFVGGRVEEGNIHNTSRQMGEYFSVRSDREATILDKSNNTVGNLKEISEYLDNNPNLENVLIASSDYHLDRFEEIRKIFGELGADYKLLPSEGMVRGRSQKHQKFLSKYEKSFEYGKAKALEKVWLFLLKVDPNQKIIEKIRAFKRRKSKTR